MYHQHMEVMLQMCLLSEIVFFFNHDQIMADRGFKIKEDLMMIMATLCIPPSCAASSQMLPGDIKKTSSIANVRNFVEQAIRRVFQLH